MTLEHSTQLTSCNGCTAGVMDPLLSVDSQHSTALAVLGPLFQHWVQLPGLLLHGAVQRLELSAEGEPPLQCRVPTTAEACQLLISWAELLLQSGQVRTCHHMRCLFGNHRKGNPQNTLFMQCLVSWADLLLQPGQMRVSDHVLPVRQGYGAFARCLSSCFAGPEGCCRMVRCRAVICSLLLKAEQPFCKARPQVGVSGAGIAPAC